MTHPQASEDFAQGDRRLAVFSGQRAWQVSAAGAIFTLIVAAVTLATRLSEMNTAGQATVPIDFAVFWQAANLLLDGTPLAVFEITTLEGLNDASAQMFWLYPPGFLLLIAPLGLLGFAGAWIALTALSFTLIALALRPYAKAAPALWLGLSFAGAFLPASTLGQNNLIWLAGLLAALSALLNSRQILAGVLIGFLTLKPQLGPLVAVALFAGGYWRAILAATLTTVVVTALPTLVVGVSYWTALLENYGQQSTRVFELIEGAPHMASAFALMVWVGVPKSLALALQTALFVTMAAAVFAIWRSARTSFDLKVAVLFCAMPLTVPYFWQYEAALLPIAALFLLRSGVLSLTPASLLLLAALWFGAWPAEALADLLPALSIATHHLVVPLSLIALVLALRKALAIQVST